jgi:hypothetical protein
MVDTLTTKQVEKVLGATFRQLDHWCRQGWVPGVPRVSGSGASNRREWPPEAIEASRWLSIASEHFVPDGHLNLPALADFVRRAAEAGVKP